MEATEGEVAQSTSSLTADKFDTTFDHILIGNDLSTLYAAALLARNNHRCCVLQPTDGARMKVGFGSNDKRARIYFLSANLAQPCYLYLAS